MTNEGQLHQISAEIGGLKKAVDMMMQQWDRQEQTATAGRRALHEKFEAFKTDVGLQIAGLSLRVDRLTDKVTLIEPSVTTFKEKIESDKEEALRDEGAKRFRVKVGAFIVACASAVGWGLHELVSLLHSK